MNIEIENDALFITERLKEIDDGYFVVYSTKLNKFQLHNKNQNDTYCITCPYESLDNRFIDFTLKTLSKNSEELFKEIDRQNEKIKNKNTKNIIDKIGENL